MNHLQQRVKKVGTTPRHGSGRVRGANTSRAWFGTPLALTARPPSLRQRLLLANRTHIAFVSALRIRTSEPRRCDGSIGPVRAPFLAGTGMVPGYCVTATSVESNHRLSPLPLRAGVEPATADLSDRCSNLLSYLTRVEYLPRSVHAVRSSPKFWRAGPAFRTGTAERTASHPNSFRHTTCCVQQIGHATQDSRMPSIAWLHHSDWPQPLDPCSGFGSANAHVSAFTKSPSRPAVRQIAVLPLS